ncbi:PKD domain-containing protein [Actinoplanes sp. NBC_00393]|uniref:PKD domain-containing protein n=1 Tax=Actinoplanes sp. NBC_00393 TaxID=2975953 RepID=UPI002E21158F
MKPRLSRPLLAALVSGALVAGGAVYTSPASAAPVQALKADPSASASADPSPSVTESETTPASPSPSVSASDTPVSPSPSVSTSDTPVSPSPSAPVSPSPSTSSNPATPDTKAPTGTFKLNRTSIWYGQTVTFSQTTLSDGDGSKPEQIVRKISFGDGTSVTLRGTQNTFTKKYTKLGKFTVTETLTDLAGNTGTASTKYTVTVAIPGKYSLSAKTVYRGLPFKVSVTNIPAGTSVIRIYWSDNTYTKYSPNGKKSATFTGWIRNQNDNPAFPVIVGKRSITATFQNAAGMTAPFRIGQITVLNDTTRPTLTITKPSSPSRVSSWKTVRGTASDKGSGLLQVRVTVLRATTSGKTYCMTSKSAWKRYTTDAPPAFCKTFPVKVAKGKWSFKPAPGLTKGYVLVLAAAVDKLDNAKIVIREGELTRN